MKKNAQIPNLSTDAKTLGVSRVALWYALKKADKNQKKETLKDKYMKLLETKPKPERDYIKFLLKTSNQI